MFSGDPDSKLDRLYRMMIKNLKRRISSLGYDSEQKEDNFFIFKTMSESASAGGTSAGGVATVVGGLGAGFNPNGDYGVYDKPKKRKKAKVIRR